MNKKTRIKFICEICGKESEKQIRHLENKGYFCKSCLLKKYRTTEKYKEVRKRIEQTNLEKYGCKSSLENRDVIKKREQTNLEKYGAKNPFCADSNLKEKILEIKKNKFEKENYNNRIKAKNTLLKNYGVEYTMQSKELQERSRQTSLEKYGKTSYTKTEEFKIRCKNINNSKSPEEKERIKLMRKETLKKRFGVDNCFDLEQTKESLQKRFSEPDFFRNRAIKCSKTRSKLEVYGISVDSLWEQSFIESHPGCKRGPCVNYTYNDKTYHWNIDFEWEGKLYEIKNPFYFNLNFPKWKPELTWAKWKKGEELGVRWYLWNPMNMTRKFPIKDELELFRNKCYVGKNSSPFNAWDNYELRFKAEENLAQQLGFGGNLLKKFLSNKYSIEELILQRFTIAKIAPRVTSMSSSEAKKYLLNSGLCLIQGIYDPCGGFGGRKQACKELNIPYEGYDVNPELIRLVGHTYQDLITMTPIQTNRIVFTSPPWNDKEVWPGSNGSITELHEKEWWYILIQEKIKAPHYIFVNGSENDPSNRHNGLFGQRNKIVTII